jgi:CheY-like chemotaxis protein
VSKKIILIADDSRDLADCLVLLMRRAGYEAHAAYDGAQAIALADQLHPQVVMLDFGMPELDGLDAGRQIRSRAWGKKTTLIAITGLSGEVALRRSVAAGFDHHLVKPFDVNAVVALLASLAILR